MTRVRGFTLIEVLAAFAVLAIGVSVVAGMLNGGRRQVRYAAELSYATQLAQSRIDDQGLTARLHAGEDEGESPELHMRWHLDIHEIADPLADRHLIAQLQQEASTEMIARMEAEQAARDAGDGSGIDAGLAPAAPIAPTDIDARDPALGQIDEQSPWQLMQLVLDVEWGERARAKARFASVRVQIRAPDDITGSPGPAGAPRREVTRK